MATTSDFRVGLVIKVDGELYSITGYQHVKPGKGGAIFKTKLKGLKTGLTTEKTFRAGEKIDRPFIELRKLEYLYNSGQMYYFMDEQTYEEIALNKEALKENCGYLKENMMVSAVVTDGEIIGIELSKTVDLKVVKTEPGLRGDTVSGTTKPAVLETGIKVQVPLFVNQGDNVRVDTRTGEYLGRFT